MTSTAPQPEAVTATPAPPPALARAESTFARGDYGALRAALAELAAPADDGTRARVAQLRAVTTVDPALAMVLGACLIALCAIFLHYVGR